ncbi:hypothetical protein, partial [Mycobacterium intracellulare]
AVRDAYFGSVQDLVDLEAVYEASTDYLEDEAYWSRNLPSEGGQDYGASGSSVDRDPYSPSASVKLDPSAFGHMQELSKKLR